MSDTNEEEYMSDANEEEYRGEIPENIRYNRK